MKTDKVIEQAVKRVRVAATDAFRLASIDPADKLGLDLDKDQAKDILGDLVKQIAKKQELLYAEGRFAVLAIFQAMDAAGKDGVIEHVFSGINPQGCQVASFKSPSAEELAHDFLWRTTKQLPPRGHIGVFNRSYYEETLVVRVHPDWLGKQKLPPRKIDKAFWDERQPRQVAADIDAMLADADPTGTLPVLLIGYSFGANILPFAWPALDPAIRARTPLVALLAPERRTGSWTCPLGGAESRATCGRGGPARRSPRASCSPGRPRSAPSSSGACRCSGVIR